MAKTSLGEEKPKAAKDSPRDCALAFASSESDRNLPARRARPPKVARPARSARSEEAFSTTHFTLYSGFASTKKRGLHLAFGVRAGPATTRNRAKRQAREAFRFSRHKLPEAIGIVITSRGNISVLPRRSVRAQLEELFARACARWTPDRADAATTT